jgi:capsule polysaccharide export protein KpsE/RkpR
MTQKDSSLGAEIRNSRPPTLLGTDNSEFLVGHAPPLLDLEEYASKDKTAARLHIVWQQRPFLLRVMIIGLMASTLIALLIPKRFSSTARLMPPQQKETGAAALLSAAVGGGGGAALMPLVDGAFGLRTTGDLFIGIIKSQTIQDQLIQKFELQKVYRTRYMEDARKELADHTEVAQDPKSGIITITVTDHDQNRASEMAREYIQQLNWVVNNLNTSAAHRERVFLENRLGQVKKDLEAAEQQFGEFASKKGAIDIQSQSKAMVQAAADLQGQMIAAQSELEGLRQIYTPNNVRVRSLEARIEELRRQLQKIGGSGANESSAADELYPSIRQLPLLGVDYADLLRRVKLQEAVFNILTQQYELSKVEEAKEIPTVKVLDPPLVPEKKSFPPRLVIILLGGMLSLSAAIGWVLVQTTWSEIDSTNPRKLLAAEIWSDISRSLPRATRDAAPAWLVRTNRRNRAVAGQSTNGDDRKE